MKEKIVELGYGSRFLPGLRATVYDVERKQGDQGCTYCSTPVQAFSEFVDAIDDYMAYWLDKSKETTTSKRKQGWMFPEKLDWEHDTNTATVVYKEATSQVPVTLRMCVRGAGLDTTITECDARNSVDVAKTVLDGMELLIVMGEDLALDPYKPNSLRASVNLSIKIGDMWLWDGGTYEIENDNDPQEMIDDCKEWLKNYGEEGL